MDRLKIIISQPSMTVLTTPFLSYYNERLTEEIGAPNAEKVIQMRFLPDYEINLISPNEIDDFSDFDSDLGVVLSYIKASVDKKELRDLTSSDERFRRVERDAFHVLNEATDSKLKMIVKEGKIDKNIMKKLGYTIQQAMDLLDIPAEEQKKYMARL